MLGVLAQKFAEDNGLDLTMTADGYGCTFSANGMKIRAVLQPGGSMLVLQTAVGVLPEENRETFLVHVLSANNFLSETNGMTLGLNAEAEVVTLQVAWDIHSLTQESFSNLVTNLLAETERWLEKFSEAQASEVVSQDAVPASHGEHWVKI